VLNWILDYASPVVIDTSTAVAPRGFLKKMLIIEKDVADETSITEYLARPTATGLDAVKGAFDSGSSVVYGIKRTTLDFSTFDVKTLVYTIVAIGFDLTEVASKNLGSFEGVFIYQASAPQGVSLRTGFIKKDDSLIPESNYTAGYTLGVILNQNTWRTLQYVATNKQILTIKNKGEAKLWNDAGGIVWGEDDVVGKRLVSGFIGGRSLVADYIEKEISIGLQENNFNLNVINEFVYNLADAKVLEMYNEKWIETNYLTTGLINSFQHQVNPGVDGKSFNCDVAVEPVNPVWFLPITIRSAV
jgi:hypothetical protein